MARRSGASATWWPNSVQYLGRRYVARDVNTDTPGDGRFRASVRTVVPSGEVVIGARRHHRRVSVAGQPAAGGSDQLTSGLRWTILPSQSGLRWNRWSRPGGRPSEHGASNLILHSPI